MAILKHKKLGCIERPTKENPLITPLEDVGYVDNAVRWQYLNPVTKTFLMPTDYTKYISTTSIGHQWEYVPTKDFISKEGIQWFANRNCPLRKESILFYIQPNSVSDLHSDRPAKFAFNWVVDGYGSMEWITDVSGLVRYKKYTQQKSGRTINYYSYELDSIRAMRITDTWSDNSPVIVKIEEFHRIITKESHRVSLSVRPEHTLDSIKNYQVFDGRFR